MAHLRFSIFYQNNSKSMNLLFFSNVLQILGPSFARSAKAQHLTCSGGCSSEVTVANCLSLSFIYEFLLFRHIYLWMECCACHHSCKFYWSTDMIADPNERNQRNIIFSCFMCLDTLGIPNYAHNSGKVDCE